MKKKLLVYILLFKTVFLYANSFTAKSVNDSFFDIYNWKTGRSSVLIEYGYEPNEYEYKKIWDDDLSTAWVEGAEEDGLEEWVVVAIDGDYQYLSYEHGILNKKLNITLKINNGFCKSEATFKNNNRVKKAEITIYEVPLAAYEDSRGTQALDEPSVMYETEIELKDSMEEQDFSFEVSPKGTFEHGSLYLYCQLTILEVYPGEKYHDTCISEMHATAEVIKEQPAGSPRKKRSKNRWQK